jgi:ElaB protein
MATDTSGKIDEAQAEAREAANHVKSAGRKAGEAASEELSNLKADLDDLIARIPGLSDVDLEEAKQKLLAKVASTRETARGMADDAREQIHHGIECSEDYVKEHPMQSVGYAALAGFLLGLLITRC